MLSIEDVASAFGGLPFAMGGVWNLYPLKDGRIYLSRDEVGRFSIFIVGSKESFGNLPRISGVDYSDSVEVIPGNVKLQAVRLTSSSATIGNRVMAHVAYELLLKLSKNESMPNSALLSEVRWILELLSDREDVLSDEKQKGLFGELMFLRKLLLYACEINVPASIAFDTWLGFDRAKRDFAGPGVAVEVKTTSNNSRVHQIGSIAQLEPQGDEEVFVFSVGVKLDSSAPRKLPDVVADTANLLKTFDDLPDMELQKKYELALGKYGYQLGRESLYRAGPGFLNVHLAPRLFKEIDLDRIRQTSFKNDSLPKMVLDVSYTLEMQAPELSKESEKSVMDRLLGLGI